MSVSDNLLLFYSYNVINIAIPFKLEWQQKNFYNEKIRMDFSRRRYVQRKRI